MFGSLPMETTRFWHSFAVWHRFSIRPIELLPIGWRNAPLCMPLWSIWLILPPYFSVIISTPPLQPFPFPSVLIPKQTRCWRKITTTTTTRTTTTTMMATVMTTTRRRRQQQQRRRRQQRWRRWQWQQWWKRRRHGRVDCRWLFHYIRFADSLFVRN